VEDEDEPMPGPGFQPQIDMEFEYDFNDFNMDDHADDEDGDEDEDEDEEDDGAGNHQAIGPEQDEGSEVVDWPDEALAELHASRSCADPDGDGGDESDDESVYPDSEMFNNPYVFERDDGHPPAHEIVSKLSIHGTYRVIRVYDPESYGMVISPRAYVQLDQGGVGKFYVSSRLSGRLRHSATPLVSSTPQTFYPVEWRRSHRMVREMAADVGEDEQIEDADEWSAGALTLDAKGCVASLELFLPFFKIKISLAQILRGETVGR
jgi:hypothetical protein